MIDKDLYTVREAMELLGVTRGTMYNWIKAENIKAVKVGIQWRIPKAEIIRISNGGFKL